jgi:hypothetical protein
MRPRLERQINADSRATIVPRIAHFLGQTKTAEAHRTVA